MMEGLGTLEELPEDYRTALSSAGVAPLWPNLRNLLPATKPNSTTQACHWGYSTLRPLLMRAGDLTPVEKAERRVLVLSDPGRGDGAMQATATIYAGLQLLLPGEVAPAHRHTPSAARIHVEGEGGFTVVNGEKLPMESGDLILTPIGQWHDHGHDGEEPVVWLDALDLPVFVQLEGSYSEAGALQSTYTQPDSSQVAYASGGLIPARSPDRPASHFPLLRFPWDRTELRLRQLSALAGDQFIALDYVNPESGDDPLPTIGFTAFMIRRGETIRPILKSSSAVYHVVAGSGETKVNGRKFKWQEKDCFSVPVFSEVEHQARDGEAFLIEVHDRPLQKRLGYYEEQPA